MQGSSTNSSNSIKTKATQKLRRDILLIEIPLEGHLVRAERRRSFLPALSALVKDLTVDAKVYHESVSTVEDLCAVLDRCSDQNGGTRQIGTAERTQIRFTHIVSHGDKRSFFLRKAGGSEPAPEQLGAEFRRIKNAGIRAVFLSSCKSARGRQMATEITQVATDENPTLSSCSRYRAPYGRTVPCGGPVCRKSVIPHPLGTPRGVRLLSESAHALARFCPEVRCLRASYLSEEPPLCLQGCRQTVLVAARQDASSHR
jgi:hypothetical protein